MEMSPEKKKRRPYVILGAIAGVAVVLYGGYRWYTSGKESTDDAQVEADVVPLAARVGGPVKQVAVTDNQQVAAGDVIVALDDADYAARAKQAEAELDAAHAQADAADAQVRIVEAASHGGLESAQAMLTGSQTSVKSAAAQTAVARANLLRAKADADRAAKDLERARGLRAQGAISQVEVDHAQATDAAARAAVAQAQAQIAAAEEQRGAAVAHVGEMKGKLAQSQPIDAQVAAAQAQPKIAAAEEQRGAAVAHVGEMKGKLAQSQPIDAQVAAAQAGAALAHARVKSAESALELARLQLSYCQIKAPAAGIVSKLAVRTGQLVQPGQLIIELVPTETYVVANFKETQIGHMKPGQPAEIEIDAYPGRHFSGHIQSASAATGARFSLLPPDNASGNFVKVVQRVPVKIDWEHPPNVPLRAGLSATVTIHVN